MRWSNIAEMCALFGPDPLLKNEAHTEEFCSLYGHGTSASACGTLLTPFLPRGYGALAPLAMVEPSVARERV